MKTSNIRYSCFALLDGKIVASKLFVSDSAKNNWCNRQYRKFGEDVTVEVYDFPSIGSGKLLETWHA